MSCFVILGFKSSKQYSNNEMIAIMDRAGFDWKEHYKLEVADIFDLMFLTQSEFMQFWDELHEDNIVVIGTAVSEIKEGDYTLYNTSLKKLIELESKIRYVFNLENSCDVQLFSGQYAD